MPCGLRRNALYLRAVQPVFSDMDSESFYLVLGVVGVGLGILAAGRFLTPEARERRRRQRNYGKTVQRVNRPAVKFTVNSPDKDK